MPEATSLLPARFSPRTLASRLPRHLPQDPAVWQDSPMAPALWALTAFPAHDTRVWAHVDADDIHVEEILRSLPTAAHAERAVVRAAGSLLMSAAWDVNLHDLAAFLSDAQWQTVCEALRAQRLQAQAHRGR